MRASRWRVCVAGGRIDARCCLSASAAKATLLSVTDPICSGCWACEPAWRRLLYHYGGVLTVRTMYGGLLPGWEGFSDPGAGIAAPADVAPHWLQVAARTSQPIDPAVWHTDPPASSYPASTAAHIVRILDAAAEQRFLRRVREAVFLEARNIARRDVLVHCAAEAGVDPHAFSVLFDADAGAHFATDMRERHALGVTVLISTAESGRPRPLVVGARPWARLESSLLSALALPDAQPARAPTVDVALEAYASGTTLEFATLLDLPSRETAHNLTPPAHGAAASAPATTGPPSRSASPRRRHGGPRCCDRRRAVRPCHRGRGAGRRHRAARRRPTDRITKLPRLAAGAALDQPNERSGVT
jgi:putative protein-disulfide isomerase